MGVARKRLDRGVRPSVVLSTVLVTLFALVVPFAGSAVANHGTRTLDVTPEAGQNAVSTTHTVRGTLSSTPDPGSPIQIDFEISGPGDTDAGDTPTSPDKECVVTNPATFCEVTYSSAVVGTDTIRGWIDHDGLNTVVDADATEGVDEVATPGDNTNEPDITDVVSKTWFTGLPAGSVLECEDESGNDNETNPIDAPNDQETYTCTIMTSGGTPAPVPGVAVDAENLNGANDPDNSAAAGTADMNDACTTDAAGVCTIIVSATEGQVGSADICFWADADADTAFDPVGAAGDGGECGEVVNTANQADVVTKTWEARALDDLLLTPQIDVNQEDTAHTVTATTVDQFGDPFGGQTVDFTITAGPNAGDSALNVVTNASGVATFTYTGDGGLGTDTIQACVDNNGNGTCDNAGTTDTASKIWIAEAATASDVEVDMQGCNGNTADLTDNSWTEEAAPNEVDNTHRVCATAVTSGGQILYGHEITFTLTGPGEFLDVATGESLGTTTTVAVGNDGGDYAEVDVYSTVTGDSVVSVAIDGQTDEGTKPWIADDPRNIDLEPEVARNEPGTIHEVTATVVDRFGNGVEGVSVTFTETGVGAFRTGASNVVVVTDASGVATAETTTLASEEGEQTITATMDGSGGGNDCDLAVDDPNDGDPAGNCTDDATKTWGPTCPGFSDDARNQIVGTPGRDVIRGTADADIICGLGGKDTLRGAAGDDLIKGGAGDDLIKGGAGDDALKGGDGPDTIYGNDGTDTCLSAKVRKGCE